MREKLFRSIGRGPRVGGLVVLVISRCIGSSIRIGEDITVKVLKVGRTRVMIGVDAPAAVRVHRDEITDWTDTPEPAPAPAPELDLKVLVVEDTPAHALLMERAMSRRGIQKVVKFSNGEDALRLLSRAASEPAIQPDLVLLDLYLPGVSGYRVLEMVRSMPSLSLIPVIVVSSSQSETDFTRCMQAGANAYLLKPEDGNEFRESIIRTIDFWTHARQPQRGRAPNSLGAA